MIVLRWLKANWKWLLFPIGIVMWFLGRRTETVVVPSALDEHDKTKAKIDKDASKALDKAESRRKLELEAEASRYANAQQKATEEAQKLADKLMNDPNATTEFLKSVGKDVRDR